MLRAFFRLFFRGGRIGQPTANHHPINRAEDDAIDELAALIQEGEITDLKLDRMADLFGQSDPNRDRF